MILVTLSSAARADLAIFDGTLQQGTLWADNGGTTVGISEDVKTPEGTATIAAVFDSAYRSAGVAFFGRDKLTIPAGATRLELTLYPSHDGALSALPVTTDAGSVAFDNSTGRWTVDGKPGSLDLLTKDAWHAVSLDLTSIAGFEPGKTKLSGQVAVKVNQAGNEKAVIRFGSIRLVGGSDVEPAAPAEPTKPTVPDEPSATKPATAPATTPGTWQEQTPKPGATTPAAEPTARTRSGEPVRLTIGADNQQEVTAWGIATQNRPDWGDEYNIAGHPASLDAAYEELGTTLVRFHIDYKTYDTPKARIALRDGILAATSHGCDWYGIPWSPPVKFKTLDTPNGRLNGKINHLAEGYEDEVAAWLVDLVKWLDSEGVPLPVGLSPQNEPDWPPPSYPGCIYSGEQLHRTIMELRRQLDEAGYTSVKIIGDEGGEPGAKPADQRSDEGTLNKLGLQKGGIFHTDAAFREALDVISTHTYDIHNQRYTQFSDYMQRFYDITHPLDKELWMSEWETRHEHTFNDWEVLTETFTHFNRDMSSMGFNAWINWQVWKGWLTPEAVEDTGDCVGRIRAGDRLAYDGINVGENPQTLTLRYTSDSPTMSLALHLDDADGPPTTTIELPQTPRGRFADLVIPLPAMSGEHDVILHFTSGEHWREASLNWFAFADQPRVEAEALSRKQATEKWSSTVQPCWNLILRKDLIHDDGTTLQRRPLFYVWKKVWTNAPAGKGTYVRRVDSSDPAAIQGESRAPKPQSYRQDISAFINGKKMTMMVINRTDAATPIEIAGLTGDNAEWFQYKVEDASTIDRDMHRVGLYPIADGGLKGLTLPARSLNIFVTDGQPTPAAAEGGEAGGTGGAGGR